MSLRCGYKYRVQCMHDVQWRLLHAHIRIRQHIDRWWRWRLLDSIERREWMLRYFISLPPPPFRSPALPHSRCAFSSSLGISRVRAHESKKYISIYSLCDAHLITHVHSIEDSKSFLISFTRFPHPVTALRCSLCARQTHKRIRKKWERLRGRGRGGERNEEGRRGRKTAEKIWNQKWIEPIRKTENKYRKKYWVNETNGWNHTQNSAKRRETNRKSQRHRHVLGVCVAVRALFSSLFSFLFRFVPFSSSDSFGREIKYMKRMKFIIYSNLIGGKMEMRCVCACVCVWGELSRVPVRIILHWHIIRTATTAPPTAALASSSSYSRSRTVCSGSRICVSKRETAHNLMPQACIFHLYLMQTYTHTH